MNRMIVLVVASLAMALAACGGGAEATNTTSGEVQAGDPVAGAETYGITCAQCHGKDLKGITGLGKQLRPSEFVTSHTEDQLAAFIVEGRPKSHPDNTTGVDMMPRGGNPSLSDQSVQDIAAYLHAQQ